MALTDSTPTIREEVAIKVMQRGPASLTDDERADVLRMIAELGRHEAAAFKAEVERFAHAAAIKAKDEDIAGLKVLVARERRSVWDSFAAAAIGNGKSVDDAAAIASSMMRRREAACG